MQLIEKDFQPVFIVGPPRCGTTLCSRILKAHASFFVPGETHFMEDIYSRHYGSDEDLDGTTRQSVVDRIATIYGRFNEPEDQARLDAQIRESDFLQSIEQQTGDWRCAYAEFMSLQAQEVSATRWANHAPKDLFYIEELATAFPSAKFVFCIRDPRDFLLSYKFKWRATSPENVKRIRALYNPILTSMLWRTSARAVTKHLGELPSERVMLLRYEDLVNNPRPMVEQLLDFVGEAFSEPLLSVGFSNSSHGQGDGTISNRSAGKWKAGLPEPDTWWADAITSAELDTFDYPRSGATINPARCLIDVLSFPFATVRALRANRDHTGPLIPYLARRVSGALGR